MRENDAELDWLEVLDRRRRELARSCKRHCTSFAQRLPAVRDDDASTASGDAPEAGGE